MPRALIGCLWIGFAAICAYWGIWFLGDRSWLASLASPAYVAFENAFPLADAWLAVSYAGAAIALARRRPSAVFWLLVAGSASFYLAGMDILFDLENGVYTRGEPGAVLSEVIINLASIGLGIWTLAHGWRNRRALLA